MLVFGGAGSVWGGTGWYFVVLGQCNLVLLGALELPMLLQQFELDKQESAARQIGMASKTLSAATATVSVALADRGDLN